MLDVRSADGGVFVYADKTTRLPYESVLGGDRGVDEVPGDVTRDELLAALTPAELGEAEYHRAGAIILEQVQSKIGNASLKHSEAKAFMGELLALLDQPAEFGKFYAEQTATDNAKRLDALTKAYASGKPSAELDAYITKQREMFVEFVSMKPIEQDRFSAPPSNEADAKAAEFAYMMLRQVRPVVGAALDHAAAASALKKALKGDALKSNASFVDQFFVRFAQAAEKARLEGVAAALASQSGPLPAQEEFAAKMRGAWTWYLTYSESPTKEQLATGLGDALLARLAGRSNANLGSHAADRQSALAAAAVASLPAERPLYVLCNAQAHSERVAAALEAAGAKDLSIVQGGVDRWLLESLPATFSPAVQSQIDDALKKALAGAPTGLAEIND